MILLILTAITPIWKMGVAILLLHFPIIFAVLLVLLALWEKRQRSFNF